MQITQRSDGGYDLNGVPLNDLLHLEGAVSAVKRPIPVGAFQVHEPFTVETTEGLMTGTPGDWLMQGVNGELYICPADIFAKSYVTHRP